MGRPLRIRFYEEKTILHITSKTAGGLFLLQPRHVKVKFLNILKSLLSVFSFKLITFVIMDNHFHLFLEVKNINDLSDDEILKKLTKLNMYKKYVFLKDIKTLRRKLSDLSEFVKNLKERFSKWFNKTFGRYGYLWGGRYKCVLIEEGEAYEVCKRYIEMNPVRAGMVENPEDYEFSGCGKMGKYMDIENEVTKTERKKIKVDEEIGKYKIPQIENGFVFGCVNFVKKFHEKYMEKCRLKKSIKYKPFKEKLFSLINTR